MPNNTIAKKQSGWTVVSTLPDVCKTPMGSSMVPVPYPVTAKLINSSNVSPNVRSNDHPVFLFDASTVVKTIGDEAGVGKGVKSGTVSGKCYPIEHSSTVRANGKYVVRHRDKFGMNG
ncbi:MULTISPECIES: DUF4150 domain-containing protein [unclassified Psychrobacter]|uniref:DUF4150 domain-containing protein n=1 Tax=unclassified Psychrobacter TaxID=196806 RepID=UPI001787D889|nr:MULTISPECIES: DUF4150 domain-containing protein [unclassified Psychrobacter]MBE0441134.1 DUF4150 domain-containing protein [Psychrobacter sp. FME13]